MPELPEVETACRGISPHIAHQKILKVIVRQPRLRWPVPEEIHQLEGHAVNAVNRRGKYLLLDTDMGTAMIHLGMSGNVRICPESQSADKHDHVDFLFENNSLLRFHDPRRFGSVLWAKDILTHPLIANLGPEPLSDAFTAQYCYEKSRNKKVNIKSFIMNSKIVVGVGNIYASESLFLAGINPKTSVGRISITRYKKLVNSIQTILSLAIEQGGTTLKDFINADGQTGYFQQKLSVYGKTNQPCPECGREIKQFTQSQRTTYYCSQCQR